jgi:MFS family permease
MQSQTASSLDALQDQAGIELDSNLTRNLTGEAERSQELSGFRAAFVSVAVSGMVFISSLSTGLLATGLPNIASNLGIPDALILWPASIYGLTCGCSLIPIGSIADVIGSGPVYLFGCVFLSLSFLACGLASTGTELIVFRGFQGVAASCCLPTAISILTEIFPQGRQQTRGMAILGAAQPLGFSAGLFLGGVLVDSIGWRWGWYIASILSTIVFGVVFRAVPRQKQMSPDTWRRLACGIDWIGALIASACLGLLSYVLA